MNPAANSDQRRPALNPVILWRWGFSTVLIAAGIWLVVTGPQLAGAQGRVLGWVVMGYAVLRLFLGYLTDRQLRRRPLQPGREGENPLD